MVLCTTEKSVLQKYKNFGGPRYKFELFRVSFGPLTELNLPFLVVFGCFCSYQVSLDFLQGT